MQVAASYRSSILSATNQEKISSEEKQQRHSSNKEAAVIFCIEESLACQLSVAIHCFGESIRLVVAIDCWVWFGCQLGLSADGQEYDRDPRTWVCLERDLGFSFRIR